MPLIVYNSPIIVFWSSLLSDNIFQSIVISERWAKNGRRQTNYEQFIVIIITVTLINKTFSVPLTHWRIDNNKDWFFFHDESRTREKYAILEHITNAGFRENFTFSNKRSCCVYYRWKYTGCGLNFLSSRRKCEFGGFRPKHFTKKFRAEKSAYCCF